MYIVDSLVTKKYWEPVFKRIVRCFQIGEFRHVEGDIYFMTMRSARIYAAATLEEDGHYHVYGWYYLIQRKGWQTWEIYQSYIFNEHRGQGWSSKLLSAMIMTEDLTLASGPQQTKHARAMWRGLIHKDEYTIWAHDFKNLESFAPVSYDPDNDTLDCALPVYDVSWNYHASRRDIRLIATRKQHDNRLRRSGKFA